MSSGHSSKKSRSRAVESIDESVMPPAKAQKMAFSGALVSLPSEDLVMSDESEESQIPASPPHNKPASPTPLRRTSARIASNPTPSIRTRDSDDESEDSERTPRNRRRSQSRATARASTPNRSGTTRRTRRRTTSPPTSTPNHATTNETPAEMSLRIENMMKLGYIAQHRSVTPNEVLSFAIWINKGGVGKSTLAFQIACAVALAAKKECNILMIDACSQANMSQMLLGGVNGGAELVEALSSRKKTIAGYMAKCVDTNCTVTDINDYLVRPSAVNASIPDNIYLVCGDPYIDKIAQGVSEFSQRLPLTGDANTNWLAAHKMIHQLIEAVSRMGDRKWIVFIDTNPAFTIYTEIAICGAQYLIIPATADESSRVGAVACLNLVYGSTTGSRADIPQYNLRTFAARAKEQEAEDMLQMPKIFMLVTNRSTQHKNSAASAYKAMSDGTCKVLYDNALEETSHYTIGDNQAFIDAIAELKLAEQYGVATDEIHNTLQLLFATCMHVDLRDFESPGVVSHALGIPLETLNSGTHEINGKKCQLKINVIKGYRKALHKMVDPILRAAGIAVSEPESDDGALESDNGAGSESPAEMEGVADA
eukprot:Opistho-2@70309